MDTALKARKDEPSEPPSEPPSESSSESSPRQIVARPRSLVHNEIMDLPEGEDPFATIERIVVRKLDIVPADQGGPFAYISPDPYHTYTADKLATILAGLGVGSYASNGTVSPFNRPLDLKLQVPTCFVLHLARDKRWRFSTDTWAVTLGNVSAQDQLRYFHLRHVLDDGTQSHGKFDPPNECRIAYFCALPKSPDFFHQININVEMFYDDDVKGKNTIPIVIDPDVRYPGGSG